MSKLRETPVGVHAAAVRSCMEQAPAGTRVPIDCGVLRVSLPRSLSKYCPTCQMATDRHITLDTGSQGYNRRFVLRNSAGALQDLRKAALQAAQQVSIPRTASKSICHDASVRRAALALALETYFKHFILRNCAVSPRALLKTPCVRPSRVRACRHTREPSLVHTTETGPDLKYFRSVV
jgi:hypothetical protein